MLIARPRQYHVTRPSPTYRFRQAMLASNNNRARSKSEGKSLWIDDLAFQILVIHITCNVQSLCIFIGRTYLFIKIHMDGF